MNTSIWLVSFVRWPQLGYPQCKQKEIITKITRKMKVNMNECLNLTSNDCNNRIFLLPRRSATVLTMYNGQQKWDMSLHPGQKHLITFHTWIVLIVLIVPIVSRDQGGNERGWRNQICWTLCLYHCPHRPPSRCRIHPLARGGLSRHQLRQLRACFRQRRWFSVLRL